MKYDKKRINLILPCHITKHDISNEYIMLILISSSPRTSKLLINIKPFQFVYLDFYAKFLKDFVLICKFDIIIDSDSEERVVMETSISMILFSATSITIYI